MRLRTQIIRSKKDVSRGLTGGCLWKYDKLVRKISEDQFDHRWRNLLYGNIVSGYMQWARRNLKKLFSRGVKSKKRCFLKYKKEFCFAHCIENILYNYHAKFGDFCMHRFPGIFRTVFPQILIWHFEYVSFSSSVQ